MSPWLIGAGAYLLASALATAGVLVLCRAAARADVVRDRLDAEAGATSSRQAPRGPVPDGPGRRRAGRRGTGHLTVVRPR